MNPIKRETYLCELINRKENGLIKVITGIRRCGKSYLLFNIYYEYLLSQGVSEENIIKISLDDEENEELREPKKLSAYIREKRLDALRFYRRSAICNKKRRLEKR